MNNNLFINNLKNRNKQSKITTETDLKYNPDVNKQYEKLVDNRSNRDFKYSNTMWKPIIGSIDKTNINTNDLKINISQMDQSNIKTLYEKELSNRRAEQEQIQKKNTKLEELKIDIDENLIKIENDFDDLKRLAINSEKTPIIDSITKLDDLLSSIKKL